MTGKKMRKREKGFFSRLRISFRRLRLLYRLRFIFPAYAFSPPRFLSSHPGEYPP